ncbi:MAG: MBL fold metallo-hydrolase [Pseudobdellovibrionaceae bacterium]|nr:MBL fold metallo-hydrolase [Bdellovibrionales bacterium]USN47235.1 MAG: MBL fold metallo-hydrolase [Pseudobdellovibrionaceae bacterium]
MAMQIKLWGVRGSLTTPKPPKEIEARVLQLLKRYIAEGKGRSPEEFLSSLPQREVGGYGGHTSCVEVTNGPHQIIIDGGSGLRPLGGKMLTGPCGLGRGEVHILFTHFHWDHLVGLPFFVPIFIPGNKIHIYAVQPELEEIIRHVFEKPYFPVSFDDLGAEVVFHQLAPREKREFGDLQVTPYQLDHPDPCWGFRVECGGKVYAHCVDTECTRVSRKDLGPDLPLYQGVDVMVFDAQYTFKEATEKVHWGHSSAPIGLDIAVREKIKNVYFVHHDPVASDMKIAQAEAESRDYFKTMIKALKSADENAFEPNWCFAHEGMVIEV